MSRWVGQADDGKRRESLKTTGGWMENGRQELWGSRNMAGEEAVTTTLMSMLNI